MATVETKLVLSRGEIYFNPFLPGTMDGMGEIYLGNTPEFTTSREVRTEQVFDSYDGQRIALEAAIIQETHRARFVTDHINMQNLAMWSGADAPGSLVQNRAAGLTETLTVYRGRYYQIGVTPAAPAGARGIESVVITKGSGGNSTVTYNGEAVTYLGEEVTISNLVTIQSFQNYEVDLRNGRIGILAGATDIADGDQIRITYEQRDVVRSTIPIARRELQGSLRFVSLNPVGPRKNLFYPLVKLTPTGDVNHKGTTWQTLSFEVEARRKNPLHQYVYIDEIAVFGPTVAEYAIDELSGLTNEQFIYWEDRLDTLTNYRIPAHNYHL